MCIGKLYQLSCTFACSASVQSWLVKMALINALSQTCHLSLMISFCKESMDFMLWTETRRHNMDYSHLIELGPADCSFICAPGLMGHGGGFVVALKSKFTC